MHILGGGISPIPLPPYPGVIIRRVCVCVCIVLEATVLHMLQESRKRLSYPRPHRNLTNPHKVCRPLLSLSLYVTVCVQVMLHRLRLLPVSWYNRSDEHTASFLHQGKNILTPEPWPHCVFSVPLLDLSKFNEPDEQMKPIKVTMITATERSILRWAHLTPHTRPHHSYSWGSVPGDTRLEQLTSDLCVEDVVDETTPPHTPAYSPPVAMELNNSCSLEVRVLWPFWPLTLDCVYHSLVRVSSWRIKYCPMKGLVKVSDCFHNNSVLIVVGHTTCI